MLWITASPECTGAPSATDTLGVAGALTHAESFELDRVMPTKCSMLRRGIFTLLAFQPGVQSALKSAPPRESDYHSTQRCEITLDA